MMVLAQLTRIGHPVLGYLIPAIIFIFSFLIAFLLYKHFSRKIENNKDEHS